MHYFNETITTYGTLFLAVTSFFSVRIAYSAIQKQAEQQEKADKNFQLSMMIDLAAKLDLQFNSMDFKKERTLAANSLLNQTDLSNAENVFDFFETLGLYLKLGAINSDVVYKFFFHWINIYWVASKEYISLKRQKSKALWNDFEYLYNTMIEIERVNDYNSKDLQPTDKSLKEYLLEEIN